MPADEQFSAGDLIGPYVIQRRIGRGGMAEVYEANRQDGVISRSVAIKLLRCHWAGNDPSVEKRFLAERQILAVLNHPGIARLLDGGVTEAGQQYVVMEYVQGLTLDDYVHKNHLTLEARLRLFASLCDAVHYAHRHLIVHRDLKPANVMVTEDGQIKLLDFGIAKLLRPEFWLGVDTPMTMPAERLATPAYAAPEQLRGEVVTTSSDVYSLGVILYRLLSGRLPYEVEGREWPEIEYLVTTAEPGPLNRPGEPAVPRDLEAIALTALRKAPAERYSSAEHLVEDIRRYLAHQPVKARRGKWIYPAWKFVQRHRTASALAAALAAVLTVSGAALAWQAGLLALERDAARDTTKFMFELFEAADRSDNREPTVREVLDEGARRLPAMFAGQPWMRAAMAEKLAGAYSNLGHFRQALPLAEESARLQSEIFGPQSLEAASASVALAALLQRLNELDRAETLARSALEIRRARLGPGDPALAEALQVLGVVAQSRPRAAEAEAAFRQALEIRRATLPATDLRLAATLASLARTRILRGDHGEAFALSREAWEIRRKAWGNRHPRVGMELAELSALALARRDAAEALLLAIQAVEILRATRPAGHPDLELALRHWANAQRASGKPGAAEVALARP